MVGRAVAHYRILEKLGAGGMGVVYKARDTHLDRFVAIKVLPPEVATAGRKARFVQEAKAASALNHPNIVTIHDIATDSGIDFIAMEHITGKTLDQLIPRKGLRLKEALNCAIQITDALAAAHAAGIVHRDLKPGNVMVNENGQVKVLDFGLAKLREQREIGEFAATETIAESPQTEEGTIVGTVSYMSPEQAEGKTSDARSDIFSFGALLYEMLTGRRAFQGASRMSTLAAILNREPEPADTISKEIPPDLSRILHRCLRKEPERRAQSMADLKLALVEVKQEWESGTVEGRSAAVRVKRRKIPWAAALVLLVTAGAAFWLLRNYRTPQPALQALPLTSFQGFEWQPSLSPDGKQVAFSWNADGGDNYDIYVAMIGSGIPLRLTTDPRWDAGPAWSPDGSSIAFVRHDHGKATLMLVPALGGPEREVAELRDTSSIKYPSSRLPLDSANWSPDGRWLMISGKDSAEKPSALWAVSLENGEKRLLTIPPENTSGDYFGAFSADGRTLAFVRYLGTQSSDLYILPIGANLTAKGEARRLTNDNRIILGVAWTADAREVVFSSDRGGAQGLWRIPISGSAEPRRLPVGENGLHPSISRQGNRLVYSQSIADTNIWRVNLLDPRELPTQWIASTRADLNPQYSPDGKRIAFESDRSGNQEVWVCDADGSNGIQLVAKGRSGSPRWSPDGQRIAFDSNEDGNWQIYMVSAHGGVAHRLTRGTANNMRPSWSHDGNWIYFVSLQSPTHRGIWKTPTAGGDAVQVTKFGGFNPSESADGKSIYFMRGAGLWRVPAEGGVETRILDRPQLEFFGVTRNGIYYAAQSGLWRFDFSSEMSIPVLAAGKPLGFGMAVSPDERWLLYTQVDQGGSDLMRVENFR